VYGGVSRVEKASGLSYPPYYLEPILPVSRSDIEIGQLGVLYARTIPMDEEIGVQVWVQLSVPLVAFGLKGTIEAVLAHEFMHYVEMISKFINLDIISDEKVNTLHESLYADYERLYDPKQIFNDRPLVRLIERKFQDGLTDEKLHAKTLKRWIEKDLPTWNLPPDANIVRLPVASILKSNFDPLLKNRLDELEKIKVKKNAKSK
jgi:hypothetical protein